MILFKITMKNKIFWVFSIVVSIILCSCEEKDGPSPVPGLPWKIESINGDVNVLYSQAFRKTVVDFGPKGGSVCLKGMRNYLTICPDTETYPVDFYKYNNTNNAVSFKNEWCEARVDGSSLYIEIQPCDTESINEITIGISDIGSTFGPYVVSICPRLLHSR